MSGIYGYVLKHRDAQAPEEAVGNRMASALAGGSALPDAGSLTVRIGTCLLGVLAAHHHQSAAVSVSVNGRDIAVALQGNIYEISGERVTSTDDGALAARLARLYASRGRDFLAELHGEFCVAVWDDAGAELLLATDRFRVHPLFLHEGAECLLFASRLKALTSSGLMRQQTISAESIIDVVATSFIPSPASIFREARKIPPGHVARWDGHVTTVEPYWDLTFPDVAPGHPRRLAAQLKEHFRRAVELRLPTGVDERAVGVFLSGGIDSSTVTGVLTQATGRPVRSFSIGFAEPRFNELQYARIAARAFGSEHHEYCVTPTDTLEALPKLLEWFDEPYANASAVPTYYCARLARDHGVEVMLAGDGGDELFAGNPWYGASRVFDHYRRLPGWLGDGLIRPAVRAAARTRNPVAEKALRYVERARMSYPDRLGTYGLYQLIPMAELFTPEFLDSLPEPYVDHAAVRRHWDHAPARTDLDRQLYIDLKLVIGDNDLLKVKRMTEAAGVSVRFPILDQELAQFAAAIPAKIKMPGKELRTFFKRAYSDMLPPETLVKRKHGFGLPIPVWLKSDPPLNAAMRDLVLGQSTSQRGIFHRPALLDLVSRHEADTTHYFGPILWNIMMVELWLREHA